MRQRRLRVVLVAATTAVVAAVAAVVVTHFANAATAFSTTVVGQGSGLCVDVPGGAATVRLRLVQTSCAGIAEQVFTFTPVSGATDTYTIAPSSSGRCVDVSGRSKADNAAIIQYVCNGQTNQRFRLVAVSDTAYNLVAVHSGKCVATSESGTAAGGALVQLPCTAVRAWRLPNYGADTTPSTSPTAAGPTASAASPDPSPTTASASPTVPAGSPSPSGGTGCARTAGTSPVAKVTAVNVGVPVTAYGQGDTDPLPMAIAATPSGGSWLAWLGTDKRVYLGKLDCNDKLVGTPTSFAGIDLQDVQADANGGVLLLTRPGDCHTGPLCGGSSSPCNTMWMVRFDNSGNQVWEQQVTNLSETLGGYDNGARFVWWYQHHGRLAYDGSNYAAYFGVAITVQNGSCVDIHEGDRMQVVSSSGALLSGHDSFAVGCSHSWTTRIAWDPRTSHFAMVCATDNNCRIAQPNPYRTVASGACDGTLFGGDLVLASTAGYWTAWSQGGQARLEHFTTGASDTTVNTGAATSHPHLVSYGTGLMLLAWGSGSAMTAQVYDAGSGTAVGSQFTVNVRDNPYQAAKAYADGSVAYPAAGSNNTTINIARVLPLTR